MARNKTLDGMVVDGYGYTQGFDGFYVKLQDYRGERIALRVLSASNANRRDLQISQCVRVERSEEGYIELSLFDRPSDVAVCLQYC